jgi:hypothetical protein
MTTYSGLQPVRNAEANNLALQMLGLGPIPGSSFNYAQDLTVIQGTASLDVTIAGDNGNKVESTSPDQNINCVKGISGGCSTSYPSGTTVSLTATADRESIFIGWSANAVAGVVTMDGDKAVTATFDDGPAKVRIEGSSTVYYTLDAALAAAPAPQFPKLATEMRAQALPTVFSEDIVMTNPVAILLKGGYSDVDFASQTGYSSIGGYLKIRAGKLLVERLEIKPQ